MAKVVQITLQVDGNFTRSITTRNPNTVGQWLLDNVDKYANQLQCGVTVRVWREPDTPQSKLAVE